VRDSEPEREGWPLATSETEDTNGATSSLTFGTFHRIAAAPIPEVCRPFTQPPYGLWGRGDVSPRPATMHDPRTLIRAGRQRRPRSRPPTRSGALPSQHQS
jgi:hypothetical protein